MLRTRTFVAGIAALASWTVLTTATASAAALPLVVCDGGSSHGSWRLPSQSQGTGLASGRWIDSTTNQTAYRFRALLTDLPTPCLSCLEGTIEGTLDDGVGASPDFVVRGRYFGAFNGGFGQFELSVLRPGGGGLVGTAVGDFEDLLGDGLAGRFLGTWRVCP